MLVFYFMSQSNVWVEKYRPTQFCDVVLDPLNRTLLERILDTGCFPHLLLYGPPGTGKTTTIINFIRAFQEKNKQLHPELVIHLNASDERGIDVIRNQIHQFVFSKTMFNKGIKFVVLDEVDYMTSNAQQALKNLLQQLPDMNIRFCLMCNYISRIDWGLQQDFMKLRFNQLPASSVIAFLKHVTDSEGLNISNEKLASVQQLYHSDVRSMINFLQSNQTAVIDTSVWTNLYNKLQYNITINELSSYVHQLSVTFNLDERQCLIDFTNFIIRNHADKNINSSMLTALEKIIHFKSCHRNYFVPRVLQILRSSHYHCE